MERENIRHLKFFVDNGIDLRNFTKVDSWGVKKTAAEFIFTDFLIRIKSAATYVHNRGEIADQDPPRHRRYFFFKFNSTLSGFEIFSDATLRLKSSEIG